MNNVEERIKAAFETYRASVRLEDVVAGSSALAPTLQRRRSRMWLPRLRWVSAAVAAAVVTFFAVVLPVLSSDPLHGALAIERQGDMLYVEVADAAADPDAMTNDLRAAGLDATASTIPVSPSLVGAWVDVVNLSGADQDPRIVALFDQIESRVETLRVPADFSSAIALYVGRPARAAERWQISSETDFRDQMSSGGRFACLQLATLTPAEVDRILEDMGYRVVWSVLDAELPSSQEVPGPPTSGVVFEARFVGTDLLGVRVATPDSHLARQAVLSSGEGC